MNNIINIELQTNRIVNFSGAIINKTYENDFTQLNFTLASEMVSKDFYLEFEKSDGTKYVTPKLTINGNNVLYTIPNSLLDVSGSLDAEVVLRDSSGLVFKSYGFQLVVLNSINASEELPSEFPDFISEAQKILDEVQKAIPTGGTTGQVLTKLSDTDYDSGWTTLDYLTQDDKTELQTQITTNANNIETINTTIETLATQTFVTESINTAIYGALEGSY